jgi:predicted metalloprotease
MGWTPGGMSGDVEDRRGEGGGGFGGMGGGGIGIIGFIVLLVISLITGHNFLGNVLSGGGQSSVQTSRPVGPAREGSQSGPRGAGNDRDAQLVSFVLDDVQKTWTQIFAAHGRTYRHAKLVLYRNATYSGCGTAKESTGPFYCPQDEKVYIDLAFWNDLKRFGGDTGDFAQAYVIAHELGHHVQKLLGIEGKMRRLSQQEPEEQNPLSVDLELQADCFAGVWAHSTEQRNIVHANDIAAALKTAAAVGDDHLQRMSGRAVSPENWTHGSSAQREQWFRRGLTGGQVSSCPTFHGALEP